MSNTLSSSSSSSHHHHPASRHPYTIRPTTPADAPSIARIQNHYIRNSIKTIHADEHSEASVAQRLRIAASEKYPAYVAVERATEGESPGGGSCEQRVIGFVSTSRFRPQVGWSPSAEVSLFLEPGCERRGVGKGLLGVLLACLRDQRVYLDREDGAGQHGREYVQVRDGIRDTRQLIAVCVVDEDDLEGYYARFGFRRIGLFERGGFKFGKWYA